MASKQRVHCLVMKVLKPLIVVMLCAGLIWSALAQSGGSFGGSFGGSSSSGGSRSGSSGSFSGSSGGSRGSSGGNIFVFGGSGGGSSDFGAGIGLIVIIALGIGVIYLVVRARGTRGFPGASDMATASAIKVQVMLLDGEEVKAEIKRIAETGNPSTREGLMRMINEVALSLLRRSDRWKYGHVELARTFDAEAGQRVGAWATAARSAYQVETTTNRGTLEHENYNAPQGGLYLVVTLAVGARNLTLPALEGPVEDHEVRNALTAIASTPPQGLIAGDVVWSPDVPGELLTEDQALRLYPALYHL